uniref:RB1-inducible coiled-coil protein 1 n=1 Tax=Petromyzon marinus TaxID=7757 RepID=A0AAJ7TX84_PETMA|nr:RB1-inducible coiled-coil protein 1-like [Petromyzon marinus]
MKLFVFLVNTGATLTFDTELALQTVAELRQAIQTKYRVGVQHQVLVVSGGECLAGDRRVCSYSAGTDTNPIFLFSKELILHDRAPCVSRVVLPGEAQMEPKVEESVIMPAVFHTVTLRTQLALEMQELAQRLCMVCESLVHDEHMQHQGWSAVTANLEDCSSAFAGLLTAFTRAYAAFLESRRDILSQLSELGDAVTVMAQIPLLQCLTASVSSVSSLSRRRDSLCRLADRSDPRRLSADLPSSAGPRPAGRPPARAGPAPPEGPVTPPPKCPSGGADDGRLSPGPGGGGGGGGDDGDDDDGGRIKGSFNVSLLDWVNVQDRPNDVETLVRKCFESMSRLEPGIVQPFLGDCQETLAKMDNPSMKSIRGLEDRLFVLDQLLASCQRLVTEQKELAQGFLANQKRAENLKDPSVLPDLCRSHANQLVIMLSNHKKLLDVKQRCATAKQELTDNLHVRLRWCYYVMHHADLGREKLQALCHVLRELTGRVGAAREVALAPRLYCLAATETLRRRAFSAHYRRWASLLVRDGKELYQAERERRVAFRQLFGHSFLKGRLFQGLESWPPSSFCTREPRAFDEQLPAVTPEDLHFLQSHSPPEMQPYLQLPTLCDFELLREHSARGRRLARAVRGAQDASLALAQLLSTKTLVGRSDGRGEAGSWEGGSPASPDRPDSLLLLSPPSHGDTGDPGREDAGDHGGSDGDPLSRDNRDLSPDSIDSQVFDFETINHPAAETHPPVSTAASTAAAATAATSTAAAAQAISPRSAGLLQSPGAVVESLYASVINAIDSQRRMRREGGDGDGDDDGGGDGGDGATGDSRLSSPRPDSWSSPSTRSDVRSRTCVARGRGCAAAFTALRASTAGVRRELAGLGEQVRSDGRQLAGLLADARRRLEEALPAHQESNSDSTSANGVERRPLVDPSHHLAQLQQQQREEQEEVRGCGLDAELTCEAERVRGLEVQLAQEAERRSDLETELAEGAERCQGLRVELAQEAQRRNSQQVLLAQQAERKLSLEVELTQEAKKHRGLAAELTQETERRVGLEKELARETERRMSLETDLVQETGRRVGWETELTQEAEKRVSLEKELVLESERRHFLESELAQEAERRVGLETELVQEAERRVGLETELSEDAGKRMSLEKELAREAERRVGLETELVQEAERRVGLETELALEAQKRRALETKLSDESKKTVGLEAQLAEETDRRQGLTAELTQETERSQTLETMLSKETKRREHLEMEFIQEAESRKALDTKLAEEAQKRTGLMVELARETERRRNLEAELVQEAETRVSLETELTQEAERSRGLAVGLAQETNRRILLEADLAHEVKAHRELVTALADETERRHELQAELADRAAEREASLHGLAALLEHERELAVAELLSCHEAEVARLTAELRQAETRAQRLEEQGEEAGGLTVELQEGVLDVEWRSREASRGRRREKPVGVALKTAGSEAGRHQQHQQQQQQGLITAAERGLKAGASSEPQVMPSAVSVALQSHLHAQSTLDYPRAIHLICGVTAHLRF